MEEEEDTNSDKVKDSVLAFVISAIEVGVFLTEFLLVSAVWLLFAQQTRDKVLGVEYSHHSKDSRIALCWCVASVFFVHVGGTRCVTSSTDNNMNIHARTTLTVEFIRGYIFKFLFYV